MWVDAQNAHATGDIPILGQLLGGPLASGLKQIVQQAFQKNCGRATSRPRRPSRLFLAVVLVGAAIPLALICAERTRRAGRFQSSSAPRVLFSPQT
jgi:hypothetical protein